MRKSLISFLAVLALSALAIALAGCSENASPEPSETSQVPKGVKTYSVARVDGEPDWDALPVLDIDSQQWLDPVDITAHAQLAYGEDALFVRMWAEEENVRAEYPESDVLANTYEDSCLEFFISPVADDARYLNFEVNPNCAFGVQIGTVKENRTRLIPPEGTFSATSERTEDGWEVVYEVPYEFIRTFYPDFTVESGEVLRANFYKCGNLTVQKHYISWNPVDSEMPNFHLPESFGALVFE